MFLTDLTDLQIVHDTPLFNEAEWGDRVCSHIWLTDEVSPTETSFITMATGWQMK